MRVGAIVGAADGAEDGDADGATLGTTVGVAGATQSIGWTTVRPLVGSCEMMRTLACAAHDSSSAASPADSVSS